MLNDLGIAARNKQMTRAVAVKTFVIRCGTPDCDWGKKMCDLGEEQLRLCYSLDRLHAATDLKLAVRPVACDFPAEHSSRTLALRPYIFNPPFSSRSYSIEQI